MEQKKKKPYVKPMFVFENTKTGELSGSPELIEQIKASRARIKAENILHNCPLNDIDVPLLKSKMPHEES